jgi:hypothetical protein
VAKGCLSWELDKNVRLAVPMVNRRDYCIDGTGRFCYLEYLLTEAVYSLVSLLRFTRKDPQ